jgi:hypothetical protein
MNQVFSKTTNELGSFVFYVLVRSVRNFRVPYMVKFANQHWQLQIAKTRQQRHYFLTTHVSNSRINKLARLHKEWNRTAQPIRLYWQI